MGHTYLPYRAVFIIKINIPNESLFALSALSGAIIGGPTVGVKEIET
jgi:hypothetical protein